MSFHEIAILHQVLIVDDMELPRQLPPTIEENIRSAHFTYPNAERRLWSGNDLRKFIKGNFAPPVLEAYDKLKPYAYKCDLARYCLLYIFGGFYVDIGVRCLASAKIPLEKSVMAFQDQRFLSPSWTSLSQSVLWSIPGRDEFRHAIDLIVANCRSLYYGSDPLYPTGPVLLGRAFMKCMADQVNSDILDDQWVGAKLSHQRFVTPDNVLVAHSVKNIGGDLLHLGLVNTNNYNHIWHSRKVYGERVDIHWKSTDREILVSDIGSKTETGLTFHGERSGLLSYGPYISLEPGYYTLRFIFSEDAHPPKAKIEIAHSFGNVFKVFDDVNVEIAVSPTLIVSFDVPVTLEKVEFRLVVEGEMTGELRTIELCENAE